MITVLITCMHRFEASVAQGLETAVACEHSQVISISAPCARSKVSRDCDTTSEHELCRVTTTTPKHPQAACSSGTDRAHAPTDLFDDFSDSDDLSFLFYQTDS